MNNRLQKSIKELLDHAKKADVLIGELREKVSKFDKEAARENIKQWRKLGLAEVHKVRDRLQHQVLDLTNELAKKSTKLKKESDKVKVRVQDTLTTVKAQIKNITEAERTKRRGRRRSE